MSPGIPVAHYTTIRLHYATTSESWCSNIQVLTPQKEKTSYHQCCHHPGFFVGLATIGATQMRTIIQEIAKKFDSLENKTIEDIRYILTPALLPWLLGGSSHLVYTVDKWLITRGDGKSPRPGATFPFQMVMFLLAYKWGAPS